MQQQIRIGVGPRDRCNTQREGGKCWNIYFRTQGEGRKRVCKCVMCGKRAKGKLRLVR